MIIHASSQTDNFAANGTTAGSIQLADTSNYYVGAIVFINDPVAALNMECTIAAIPDSSHLIVREKKTFNVVDGLFQAPSYGVTDISGYKLANGASVTMPAQILQGNDEYFLHHISYWNGLV
jgi:hypothetical protein